MAPIGTLPSKNHGALEVLSSLLRLRPSSATHSSPGEYEPLYEEPTALDDNDEAIHSEVPFSWVEYWLFGIIGMAMLWPWNMFLASAPYFQARFSDSPWILQNFQSAILTVSTLSNLLFMYILTKAQKKASYPFRMNAAFIIDTGVFALFGLSTMTFLDVSPGVYLFFVLIMVAVAALATGLIQNGSFAFTASFGRHEYTQALMTGQGVAGVLPPVAQVLISLAASEESDPSEAKAAAISSALFPFLTAVLVSLLALVSLVPLIRRHNHIIENHMTEWMVDSPHSVEDAERAARKVVPLTVLASKLRWPGAGIFMCFAIAMFFPVFTSKIVSIRDTGDGSTSGLFRAASFIPLGFLIWNIGDFLGRISAAWSIPGANRPRFLFLVSLLRIGFLPLYYLCNIGGRGATIPSDFFYLFLIQLPFGMTNGWLCSCCMIVSGDCIEENEREATGGFMGLALVAGLSAGSVLSFTVAGA